MNGEGEPMITDPQTNLIVATAEANRRFDGDVDPETGEEYDDWGYSEAQRAGFVAGAVWTLKGLLSDDDAATAIEGVINQWGMPLALGLRMRGIRLVLTRASVPSSAEQSVIDRFGIWEADDDDDK